MNETKRTIVWRFWLALAVTIGLVWPGTGAWAAVDHEPITLKLVALMAARPEVKKMLNESIEKAGKINPDRATNPVFSVDAYLDYIDKTSKLIPREILANPPSIIHDQILQSICYFYFLIDQPLHELADKDLFKPSIQYYPPFPYDFLLGKGGMEGNIG